MKKQYKQPTSTTTLFAPTSLLATSGIPSPPTSAGGKPADGGTGSGFEWGGSTDDPENSGIIWNPD